MALINKSTPRAAKFQRKTALLSAMTHDVCKTDRAIDHIGGSLGKLNEMSGGSLADTLIHCSAPAVLVLFVLFVGRVHVCLVKMGRVLSCWTVNYIGIHIGRTLHSRSVLNGPILFSLFYWLSAHPTAVLGPLQFISVRISAVRGAISFH